jgi:hypothetical protein
MSALNTITEETRHYPPYIHLRKKRATARTMHLRKTYATVHTKYTACVEMARQSSPVHSNRKQNSTEIRLLVRRRPSSADRMFTAFNHRAMNKRDVRILNTSSGWKISGHFVTSTGSAPNSGNRERTRLSTHRRRRYLLLSV